MSKSQTKSVKVTFHSLQPFDWELKLSQNVSQFLAEFHDVKKLPTTNLVVWLNGKQLENEQVFGTLLTKEMESVNLVLHLKSGEQKNISGISESPLGSYVAAIDCHNKALISKNEDEQPESPSESLMKEGLTKLCLQNNPIAIMPAINKPLPTPPERKLSADELNKLKTDKGVVSASIKGELGNIPKVEDQIGQTVWNFVSQKLDSFANAISEQSVSNPEFFKGNEKNVIDTLMKQFGPQVKELNSRISALLKQIQNQFQKVEDARKHYENFEDPEDRFNRFKALQAEMETLFIFELQLIKEFETNTSDNQKFAGYTTFIENILSEIRKQREYYDKTKNLLQKDLQARVQYKKNLDLDAAKRILKNKRIA